MYCSWLSDLPGAVVYTARVHTAVVNTAIVFIAVVYTATALLVYTAIVYMAVRFFCCLIVRETGCSFIQNFVVCLAVVYKAVVYPAVVYTAVVYPAVVLFCCLIVRETGRSLFQKFFIESVLKYLQRWRHFQLRRKEVPFLDHPVGEKTLPLFFPMGGQLLD